MRAKHNVVLQKKKCFENKRKEMGSHRPKNLLFANLSRSHTLPSLSLHIICCPRPSLLLKQNHKTNKKTKNDPDRNTPNDLRSDRHAPRSLSAGLPSLANTHTHHRRHRHRCLRQRTRRGATRHRSHRCHRIHRGVQFQSVGTSLRHDGSVVVPRHLVGDRRFGNPLR